MSSDALRAIANSSLAKTGVAWLRELRHVPDSLAHQRRRAAARAQVLSLRPKKIVFVCYGNICRSPFAAALFERLLPPELLGQLSVDSAGFIGPNRNSPRTAIVAAQKYGVDLSNHRSSVITTRMLNDADLVVVMAPDQARGIAARLRLSAASVMVLGDLDPLLFERRAILDPWNGTHEVFDRSYSRLFRCVAELSRLVSEAYGVTFADPVQPANSDSHAGEALAEQEA